VGYLALQLLPQHLLVQTCTVQNRALSHAAERKVALMGVSPNTLRLTHGG